MRMLSLLLVAAACTGTQDDVDITGNTDATAETGTVPTDPSFTPDGEVRLALTGDTSCMLDASGSLVCWGANAKTYPSKRTVGLQAIAHSDFSGPSAICVANSKETFCRGGNLDNYTIVGDGVTSLAAAVGHVCALADGEIVCGGTFCQGGCVLPTTKDPYTAVSASFGRTCAIAGGAVVCTSDAPPSEVASRTDFESVAQSVNYQCAVDQAGSPVCWGSGVPKDFQADAPGDLIALSLANFVGCGLKRNGVIACWGEEPGYPTLADEAPQGQFDEVQVTPSHGCARVGDDVTCWGRNDEGQATPPS